MTFPARLAVLALLAAAPALAQDQKKAFGVLLLGEGGDTNWRRAVASIRETLAGKFPVEFAAGEGDAQAMQKGLDRLHAAGVRKIVVVPLLVSGVSDALDYDRYLLGIRKDLPKPYLEASASPSSGVTLSRLQSRVPLALTKTLDESAQLAEILADRAKAMGHDPAKETVLLVGLGPRRPELLKDWLGTAELLAERVRRKGGYKAARAAALRADLPQAEREKEEAELRALVKKLRPEGEVLVVPLELAPEYVHLRLPKALDGVFLRYTGTTILPDGRVAKWVEESARAAAALPDMRVFKESSRPKNYGLPAMPSLIPKKGGT